MLRRTIHHSSHPLVAVLIELGYRDRIYCDGFVWIQIDMGGGFLCTYGIAEKSESIRGRRYAILDATGLPLPNKEHVGAVEAIATVHDLVEAERAAYRLARARFKG